MVDVSIHSVIDNGSGFTKAGYSGEEAPRFIFPTIVGKTKVEGVYVGIEKKESIIGEEAQQKFGILDIDYPINEGIITNWNNMEKVWHHTFFSVLQEPPEENNVLLTESPLNSRKDREKTISIMFDVFNVAGFYLASQSQLSAYSVGKTTGMIYDCGEGCTNIVPLYEGFIYRNSVKKVPLAGKSIFNLFVDLLTKNGQKFKSKMEKEYIKQAIKDYCYVSYDLEQEVEINADNIIKFELPDKNIIEIKNERFEAPESLFQPKLYGYNYNSLHEEIINAYMSVDNTLRNVVVQEIIFNGGTSLLKGFRERFMKELDAIFKVKKINDCKEKKVHFYPEAEYMAWIGGSILSSLNSFKSIWISKSNYEECGPSIIHRRCI